ncbi:ribonuclease HI family protein [bacterium]|nr:ribonuclease HI family protein [bacterium]
MNDDKRLKVYCDGGSRGNPGPAASGVVFINQEGVVVGEYSEYLGVTTNNQAEYRAVLLALKKLEEQGVLAADFYLDSELVTKQIKGEYRMKNPDLRPIYEQIKLYEGKMQLSFTHVRREYNKLADAQVNKCLDQYSTKG